jgi:urease accessory protein
MRTPATELSPLALARLLRLTSPILPVGAYSYSQGLEWAIESGAVRDATGAAEWIEDALALSLGGLEAPVWWRLYCAWKANDEIQVNYWNQFFLAHRETRELRAETLQMGFSLKGLLTQLPELSACMAGLSALDSPAFPTVFSFAAWAWEIPGPAALLGYLSSWAENQVLVAIKTIPMGQVAGQRILSHLTGRLPVAVERATSLLDDALVNFAPGLALASSLHETQYSRLFRS